jgi:hypothetical protein
MAQTRSVAAASPVATRGVRGVRADAPHAPHDAPPPPPPAASAGPPPRRRFVGARGEVALRRYKYTAIDRSIIAPWLQPFWTRFVQLVPLWVAPNCITVSGLALIILSCGLSWHTSPQLDVATSTAVMLTHAGLLFAYQTLDAVDGKQARVSCALCGGEETSAQMCRGRRLPRRRVRQRARVCAREARRSFWVWCLGASAHVCAGLTRARGRRRRHAGAPHGGFGTAGCVDDAHATPLAAAPPARHTPYAPPMRARVGAPTHPRAAAPPACARRRRMHHARVILPFSCSDGCCLCFVCVRPRCVCQPGELCDHTCDALVCTFAGLAMASTLTANAGGAHTALALWFVGTGPFCLATWRMFCTGVMTLPEFNGPNEGLALLYLTHLASAAVGQGRRAPSLSAAHTPKHTHSPDRRTRVHTCT